MEKSDAGDAERSAELSRKWWQNTAITAVLTVAFTGVLHQEEVQSKAEYDPTPAMIVGGVGSGLTTLFGLVAAVYGRAARRCEATESKPKAPEV